MKRSAFSHLLIAVAALMVSAAAVEAAPMTRTPTGTITFNYTKKGALPADQTVTIKAPTTTEIFFVVDSATLPDWLTLDKTSGNPTSAVGAALKFGVSAVVANKPVGTYTANVDITSTSAGVTSPLTIPFVLVVKAAPASITASSVTYSAASWKWGDPLPTATLTVASDGEPVNFTVVATPTIPAAPAWISVSPAAGIAYSWGTTVSVTFAPSVFQSAPAGSSITGKLVITKVGGTALAPINLSIPIDPPAATVTSIFPAKLPKVITANTTRTISVKGTNFAHGMVVKFDPDGAGAQVEGTLPEACTAFSTGTTDAWCLQSNLVMFVRLSAATLAKGTPGTPGILTAVAATINVPIETKPIVYSVNDGASFADPGDELDVSPFELISIFGENFGSPTVPPAVASGRFPNSLDTGTLLVHFRKASDDSALVKDSDGYLLLWTPTQINLLVPSTLPTAGDKVLEMIVTAASGNSDVVSLDVAAATPGVLTFSGGQGQAVAVNPDGTINSATNPSRFGQGFTLYMSGLGAVDGGANIATASGTPTALPADCASLTSYLTRLNLTATPDWDTADGAVVDITPNVFPPCLNPSAVSMTLGGADASSAVAYAGWTSGSVAGLYQVSVVLPAASTLTGLTPAASATAQQYPIVITVGGVSSQTGVYVYIKN